MNKYNNDGGPAFPIQFAVSGGNFDPVTRRRVPPGESVVYIETGMSLRDRFAIAALQMLGAATQDETVTSLENRADDTARACYTIADAMLRARTIGT